MRINLKGNRVVLIWYLCVFFQRSHYCIMLSFKENGTVIIVFCCCSKKTELPLLYFVVCSKKTELPLLYFVVVQRKRNCHNCILLFVQTKRNCHYCILLFSKENGTVIIALFVFQRKRNGFLLNMAFIRTWIYIWYRRFVLCFLYFGLMGWVRVRVGVGGL